MGYPTSCAVEINQAQLKERQFKQARAGYKIASRDKDMVSGAYWPIHDHGLGRYCSI